LRIGGRSQESQLFFELVNINGAVHLLAQIPVIEASTGFLSPPARGSGQRPRSRELQAVGEGFDDAGGPCSRCTWAAKNGHRVAVRFNPRPAPAARSGCWMLAPVGDRLRPDQSGERAGMDIGGQLEDVNDGAIG
jgi:hypothetical protein